MAAADFGLKGVADVTRNLERIVRKVQGEAVVKALTVQAERLVVDVVANTPVVSGAAAGSVKARAATPVSVEVTAGGSDAPYFPLIEFGGVHNRQPTAPFRRALEQRRMHLVPDAARAIRAAVPELKG